MARSLPWRKGDVTRLKDDSPEGMMRYIATHTTGWWQEMAERALRDTEKAERMAREAGWQPGQYWSLEVDVEAKQKLLEAEEAKRQREEAERAKEAAEKETFMQRQMELLKKAGRAPRCEYVYTDGRGCRAPQVKGERWCHGHAKMMSYRPEKLELEPMEDEQAVMVNLYRVTKSLLAGRITEKTAGLMLWSVAIGAPGAGRRRKTYHGGTETRRKTRKRLPRINADERGSENKQLANGSWQLARTKTFEPQRTQRPHKGKTHHGGTETGRNSSPLINTDDTDQKKPFTNKTPKTFETQRSGVNGGKRLSRELTRMNRNRAGVTNGNSFNSGVEGGVPQGDRGVGHRDVASSGDRAIGGRKGRLATDEHR